MGLVVAVHGLSCPLHVGSSQTRNRTCAPWISRLIFKHLTTGKVPSFNFLKHQWLELWPMVVVSGIIDIPELSTISLNEGKTTNLLIKNPSFSWHSSSFVFHLFLPRSRESGWYKTISIYLSYRENSLFHQGFQWVIQGHCMFRVLFKVSFLCICTDYIFLYFRK